MQYWHDAQISVLCSIYTTMSCTIIRFANKVPILNVWGVWLVYVLPIKKLGPRLQNCVYPYTNCPYMKIIKTSLYG